MSQYVLRETTIVLSLELLRLNGDIDRILSADNLVKLPANFDCGISVLEDWHSNDELRNHAIDGLRDSLWSRLETDKFVAVSRNACGTSRPIRSKH